MWNITEALLTLLTVKTVDRPGYTEQSRHRGVISFSIQMLHFKRYVNVETLFLNDDLLAVFT